MNTRKLVNDIGNFEIKNRLYSNSVLSMAWKNTRSAIYYSLQKDKGVFTEVKPSKSIISKLIAVYFVLYNSVFNRPRFDKNTKYIVIQHPRSKRVGFNIVDSYSHEFTNNIANEAVFLYRTSIGEAQKKNSYKQASLDILILNRLIKRIILSKEMLSTISGLVDILNSKLKMSKNKYCDLLVRSYKDTLADSEYFSNLLSKSAIEKVYIVDHYSKNVPLIAACKKLGIKVIEFQHGIISKYHLGYSVADVDKEWPGYPDEFLAWGAQWLNGVQLPNSVKISYIQPSYLEEVKDTPKANKLLIVSQSVIGQKIAKYCTKHINFDVFDDVIFKLHPSEADLLKQYQDIFRKTNVSVSTENIYPMLNECETVLGVFSTVMLEAIDFNCDVYYIDLPGAEYIKENPVLLPVTQAKFHEN